MNACYKECLITEIRRTDLSLDEINEIFDLLRSQGLLRKMTEPPQETWFDHNGTDWIRDAV